MNLINFRGLRRQKRQLTTSDAWEVLKQADHGVFSTISVDTGHPYGVFVNHLVYQDKIYFHAATMGHKLDNILENNKCSFTATLLPEVDQEGYTTRYQSAVVFGTAKQIENKKEKKEILFHLSKRYVGTFMSKFQVLVAGDLMNTAIIEITVEHITGKYNPGKFPKKEELSEVQK